MEPAPAAVDLYWLPLGAGGHCVKYNGRVFEWVVARREHRAACDLYHAALEVRSGGERYVIETAPAWDARAGQGAVATGPVGWRPLGRSKWFRYELRRWRDGSIPDIAYAVASPQRLSDDPATAARVLALTAEAPVLTWTATWNSNSVVAWLLERSGIGAGAARLPDGGRAPGWEAGVTLARAQPPSRAIAPQMPAATAPAPK